MFERTFKNIDDVLWKETAQKVDLEAIEKLCLLFKCQVGDLLELTQQ